jgi:hypothetical protein
MVHGTGEAMRVSVFLLIFLPAAVLAQQSAVDDAYLDARARELVRLARARRDVVDRTVTSYAALAEERLSVKLRSPLRDRLVYRRETASRIEWQRGGPINITAIGAREVVPIVSPAAAVPGDLDFLPALAFDPADPEGLIRIDTTVLRHPLSAGAEVHYRYATGAATSINLGQKLINLIELRVEPRRSDVRLMRGSVLLDEATHAVVQVVFRLARDYDIEIWRTEGQVVAADRSQLPSPQNDSARPREFRRMPLPGFLKPMRAQLQYVTIEYSLLQLRWWLPRLIAAEGVAQVGAIKTPLHYERTYSYEAVTGDSAVTADAQSTLPLDTATADRPCRVRAARGISVMVEGSDAWSERYRQQQEARHQRMRAFTDSLIAAGDTARARRRQEAMQCGSQYHVTIRDSAALVTSPQLPASIYSQDELISAAEVNRLARQIKGLPGARWLLQAPRFSWGLGGNGLLRYNKVEGLAVGARTEFDFGRLRADASAHLGFADLEPKIDLSVLRNTVQSQLRLGLYRRLAVMDQAAGFGGLGASLHALLFGEDDRDYYRATGIELSRRPAEAGTQWYELGLFAEQQRARSRETNFSIAHTFNRQDVFAPNRAADPADQAGGWLTLRAFGGQDPRGFTWSAELGAYGSTGTFDFTRESARLQIGFPLPFGLAGALEGAAGTSTGSVPTQSLWYLGGSHSLRGFDIGVASGTAFWRTRAELGTAFPGARLVVFTDLGWAGQRNRIETRASLLSAGAGASFLNGIVRLDLARALRGQPGWKFHLSVNRAF